MVLFVDSIDKFASYHSFHKNPVNIVIHVLMVPMIVFSGILMGLSFPWENEAVRQYVPPQYVLPHLVVLVLVVILFATSYLLEPFAGLIFNLELVAMYYSGLYLLKEFGHTDLFWIGLAVHVVAWVAQFIGHGVFEGRKPALLTNITQTLTAPTFVILEVLFILGYRPQLKKDVDKAVIKHLPKKIRSA